MLKIRLALSRTISSAVLCVICTTWAKAGDNLLDGLATGPLDGQSGWSASSGIEVKEGAGGAGKVIEVTDFLPESLQANLPVTVPGTGSVSFRARASGLASAKDSSGLFVVLSCSLSSDGREPDPFFMIGLAPNGNDIAWHAHGGGADGKSQGVVSDAAWYQFDVTFDISHGELGDNNQVDFTVKELTSGNIVAKESFQFPNQNGARKTLSNVQFVTGSKHGDSVWEVGSLMVEPAP